MSRITVFEDNTTTTLDTIPKPGTALTVDQGRGPQGAQGPPGTDGSNGAPGAKGDKGDKGDTGDAGPQGPQGVPGAPGDAGPPGPPGSDGAPGAPGADGAAGAKGDKGDTGDTGPSGPPGADGATGATGATGPQGPPGIKGDTGLQGPPGTPGADGAIGPKGDKGDTGATGATGATGTQGPAGADGKTWYSGAGAPASGLGVNGDFYLNETNDDIYKKTVGAWAVITNIKGVKGDTGPAGSSSGGGGGSRFDNPADVLWGPAQPEDIEFEIDDTSGAAPTGYTMLNLGTGTFLQQWGNGILTHPGQASGGDVKGFYRAAPSGAFSYTAKLSSSKELAGQGTHGILLRRSSDGKLYTLMLVNENAYNIGRWVSPTAFDTSMVNGNLPFDGVRYIRLRKVSVSDWSNCVFECSNNGMPGTWRSLYANDFGYFYAGGFDQIGLCAWKFNDANPSTALFEWARRRN